MGAPLDDMAGEGELREGRSESDGEYSGAASSAASRGHSPGKKDPSSFCRVVEQLYSCE